MSSASALLLIDIIDNFEFGLSTNTSSYIQFGEDTSPLAIVNDGVNDSNSAVRLETGDSGFTSDNQFIGFSKEFAFPIDTSGFSHIAYFARSPNTDDTSRFVVIELVVGEGGQESGQTGSTWTQQGNTRHTLAELGADYTRVLVPLDTASGFFRTAGSGELVLDLSNITRINIVMVRGFGANATSKRTVVVDDIVFLDLSSPHSLSVQSDPISGVDVSGTVNGTTPIADIPVADSEQVTLEVDPNVSVGNTQHIFSRWEINGIEQSPLDTVATFTMYQDTTAVAVYAAAVKHTLTVSTAPDSSTQINGNPAGITSYQEMISDGAAVTLNAPEQSQISGTPHSFIQWRINGQAQDLLVNTVTFPVTTDTTAVAEYDSRNVVTVSSTPVDNLTIAGNDAAFSGTTDYVVFVDDGTAMQLTAPMDVPSLGINFVRWTVTRGAVTTAEPDGNRTVSITNINENVVALAVFESILSLSDGWNLLSVPVATSDSIDQLFPGTVNRRAVWRWDNEKFRVVPANDNLQVFDGHWIFSSQDDLQIKPDGTVPGTTTVTLQPGWNLFGIAGHSPGPPPFGRNVIGDIWGWDADGQAFIKIDSEFLPIHKKGRLFPGKGYWVYLLDSQSVNLIGE